MDLKNDALKGKEIKSIQTRLLSINTGTARYVP